MSVEQARRLFEQSFGRSAAVVASAPGRVNLIGEHTDYNGGDVLPMAIEARTYVAMATSRDGRSHAVTALDSAMGTFAVGPMERTGNWWDYVAAPLAVLASLGKAMPEVEVAVVSDVPAGAGLSSSAALELATLFAATALEGREPDANALARVAHRAEHDVVGVPCGIMDQFASALARSGHALHLACDTERVRHVPFSGSVLVFDTAIPRALRTSHYGTRRAECDAALGAIQERHPEVRFLARATREQLDGAELSPTNYKRARHVIEETERVAQTAAALSAGSSLPGQLFFESHRSLRDLYECSSPELDWFVDRASVASGISGARLTGAGWGGCAIAIGTPDALKSFGAEAAVGFGERFGHAARWWITRASAGARVDWVQEAGASA